MRREAEGKWQQLAGGEEVRGKKKSEILKQSRERQETMDAIKEEE